MAALQYNLQRGAQMAAQQNWVTASVITHNRELETRSRSEALGLWPTFSQPSACETFHTQKRCEMKREKKKKKIPSPSQFSNNLQTPKAQIDVKKKKRKKSKWTTYSLWKSGGESVDRWRPLQHHRCFLPVFHVEVESEQKFSEITFGEAPLSPVPAKNHTQRESERQRSAAEKH